MRQIILFIAVVLWWITLSCTTPRVRWSVNDHFNFRQFIYFDNIVEFAIVDTMIVEGRKLNVVEPLTYFKFTGKLFTHYIPEYPSAHDDLLGDTVLLFYKGVNIRTYDKNENEPFDYYTWSPCGDIAIYKNTDIFRPEDNSYEKLKSHFSRMMTSDENKGFIYYHDDGSKWLEGQFKNGKPSGTWIEYYPKHYGKELIATRANFETGFVLVQLYKEGGKIEAIHYRMALPK